ncbi:ATP-binding cassette domain-containing protein [Marinicella sp. W31]|uniref:ATP-binding cassette domain-containing protein n=1 Tax=Marinicella sp. W31 TaxID=3023713 RepID=UPI00375805D9
MSFEYSIAHARPRLDIAFETADVGIVGLFGPSGSGKTSVLRSIAGLLSASDLNISYQSRQWQHFSIQERPIAWMGQQAHLFPHWSIAENLQFALQQKKLPFMTCEPFLQVLACQDLLERRPDGLSGGEYQRVCLVRALALSQGDIQVLLLDEPLSALNAHLRKVALRLISEQRHRLLIFFVSHQLEDIYCLCDQLLLLDDGQLVANEALEVLMSSADNDLNKAFHYVLGGQKYLIYSHEVALSLYQVQDVSVRHVIACEIISIVPYGNNVLIYAVDSEGQRIVAEVTTVAVSELGLATGLQMYALFKSTGLIEIF